MWPRTCRAPIVCRGLRGDLLVGHRWLVRKKKQKRTGQTQHHATADVFWVWTKTVGLGTISLVLVSSQDQTSNCYHSVALFVALCTPLSLFCTPLSSFFHFFWLLWIRGTTPRSLASLTVFFCLHWTSSQLGWWWMILKTCLLVPPHFHSHNFGPPLGQPLHPGPPLGQPLHPCFQQKYCCEHCKDKFSLHQKQSFILWAMPHLYIHLDKILLRSMFDYNV